MLWATIAPLLLTTVKSLALAPTDPLYAATWDPVYRDQQRPMIHPVTQAELVLQITSSRDVMTVERRSFDPAGDGGEGELTGKMHGMREFTLNVQARSYDLTYAAWAHEYCERVRTRIQRFSVLSTLIANNVAFVSAGVIQDVPGKEDGQALSICDLDLFFRAGFEESSSEVIGWIERIELTSHVKRADGTEFPVPPNFTEEQIPAP